MRHYPPAVAAHLAARKPVLCHLLLWIGAKHRTSGALEFIGLWTGDDHQVIAVGGLDRTYFGAGGLIGMEPLTQRTGLEVREHQITLSPLADEVVQAIRIYEPRLAPIEIHEWYFDPDTMTALAAPLRAFRGHIIAAPITTPEEGGEATCEITAVSAAWALTRPLTLKRSHAALTARASGDTFRLDADISGAVETAWGENIGKPETSTATTGKKSGFNLQDAGDR